VSAVDYGEFIATKLTRAPSTGLDFIPEIDARMFPFQADLVRWALRRGRAALFADTGLGKTRMQIEWARHVGDVLILAPLAVARQTASEGAAMGVEVTVCRSGADVRPGVNVTNYDRLHLFDSSVFRGVVLDESSIIKHHDAKTLGMLMDAFASTPFKLCATATPSPNDYTELGTHAEFLGVCTRAEMLSEFFVHDGGDTSTWRLKGHARAAFWSWVASWAALLRLPSDLGYSDTGYVLPPMVVHQTTIAADVETTKAAGLLFAAEASTLAERRDARRASIGARVAAVAAEVNADIQPWIVWCDLNAESEALTAAIPGAVEIRGSHTTEEKEAKLAAFAEGSTRVLVSKPSICGFGLNWQHCARVVFVGVTDSFEAYYQAVRRCYRFGQTRPVHVHVFASELEGRVVANLQRKEKDAQAMAAELSTWTRASVLAEVRGLTRTTNIYNPTERMRVPSWLASETA
jgi:hypothetical protein